MDEFIKLPTSFGLEISKILSSKYNIESRLDKNGMITLEYTQDELNKIESLSLYNPPRNLLDGIEQLQNLSKLEILTYGKTNNNQTYNNTTLSSDDIKRIEQLKNLKSLKIVNQSSMQTLDLKELKKLESLVLDENDNLTNIYGLDGLDKLKKLHLVENNKLYKISNLNKILLKLKDIKLNLCYFSDCVGYNHRTFDMDMISLQYMVNLNDKCLFVDEPIGLKPIKYNVNDALKFHQKCINILNSKFNNQIDKLEVIVGLESFLAKNVLYDYESLKNDYTNDKQGMESGATSAYNAIMYGSCISSGYSKLMSYLLKQLDIKNHVVNCVNNTNIASTYQKYILPEDGYHSVVSIDDYGNLYCDPCWDAWKYQMGDTNYLPFTLRNREEMASTHTFVPDKYKPYSKNIVIPYPIIDKYIPEQSMIESKRRVA